MAWERWFPDFRVPKEIQKLVRAGVLKDTTWRHDASPNFDAVLASGAVVTFWVEHPNPNKRIGMEARYGMTFVPPGSRMSEGVLETDDLHEAMEALKVFVRESGGPRRV